MTRTFFVDETKAKGYVVAVTTASDIALCRKEYKTLLLPGQRGFHMKDEKLSRKQFLADAIAAMAATHGVEAVIYDAGRRGTEKDRRARALQAIVDDVARYDQAKIILDLDETMQRWDRQRLIEYTRQAGARDRVEYDHATEKTELLLGLPDAIAWCWAQGGTWRQCIAPAIKQVRQV